MNNYPKFHYPTFLSNRLKMEQRFDISSAIDKFQRLLQRFYCIANSLQGIKEASPYNQMARKIQLIIIVAFIMLNIRFFFLSTILLLDVERMHYYQYINVDIMEQLNILGRTVNVIYAVALIPITIDKILLMAFESRRSLEFLTELTVLTSRKSSGGLTVEEKKKLAAVIHGLIYIIRLGIFIISLVLSVLQIVGCILFVVKISRSWTVSLTAILYCCFIVVAEILAVGHICVTTLMTHVTTFYFSFRVNSLARKIKLMHDISEQSLSKAMDSYDGFIFDLQKHNDSLKYFIRNMFYGYLPLTSVVIYILTVDTNIWLRILVICASSFFTLMITVTQVFVGHLHGSILELYKELNNIIPKVTILARQREITFDTLLRLQMAIKELGSERKDGQFTVGLTNGKGASFKSIDAFQLTLTTLQFTILIIKGI